MRVRSIAAVVGIALVVVWAPLAGAQTRAPADLTKPPTGLQPGDRVEDHGVAVIVPPRGTAVTAHATLVNGSQSLDVATRFDGRVVVSMWGDERLTVDAAAAAAPGPCADDFYNPNSYFWNSTFRWYFNAGSAPSEVNVDNAEQAMRDAVRNIITANNSCSPNLPDNVSAQASYQGRTTANVDINNDGTCQDSGNGTSSVGFGTLPAGKLGKSCVWRGLRNAYAYEADVRLNKANNYKWVVNIGSGCSGKWSVEAVMTHERGHTFGLGDVDEGAHQWLTMSETINGTCQASETTLGLGDILGLESKY